MNQILTFILLVLSAVYAGACVSIALVDLPFIKSIANYSEGISIFGDLLMRMGKLMIPQLAILLTGSLYFSFLGIKQKQPLVFQIPLSVLLPILLITLIVHIPINKAVISGALSPEEWPIFLDRWYLWHWVRTGIAFLFPFVMGRFFKVFA